MNYTPNHHLPQWVKSDRIMMDDFNQMCRDLEASLNTNAQAAAAARSAANSAQSAANSAQSTANAASQKQYVVGTYTGTGANQSVHLGFRPAFVIINGLKATLTLRQGPLFGDYSCATTGSPLTIPKSIEFTSSGFTVKKTEANVPFLTEDGRTYEYIAFK